MFGDGVLAQDICIENMAGAWKYQADALRVNVDLVAFYGCSINGYQNIHCMFIPFDNSNKSVT